MFPLFRTTASIFGGSLKNCTIDMSNNRITNLGKPIESQDAVSKRYVDTLVTTYSVILNADLKTYLTTKFFGAFLVTISPTMQGGPSAVYSIAKSATNDSQINTRGNRISSSRAESGETVELEWNSEGNIYIYKTGVGADGTYLVKVI